MLDDSDSMSLIANLRDEPVGCLEAPQSSTVERLNAVKSCADRHSRNNRKVFYQHFAIWRADKPSSAIVQKEQFNFAGDLADLANDLCTIPLIEDTSGDTHSNWELIRKQSEVVLAGILVELSGLESKVIPYPGLLMWRILPHFSGQSRQSTLVIQLNPHSRQRMNCEWRIS